MSVTPGPTADHLARSLITADERQADRRRISAGAKIGVDVVDAAGALLNAHLAGAGCRYFDLFVGQYFRATNLVYAHCRDHRLLLALLPSHGDHRKLQPCGKPLVAYGFGTRARRRRIAMIFTASTAAAKLIAK